MIRHRLTALLLILSALDVCSAGSCPATTSVPNVYTATHGDRGAAIPVLYDYPGGLAQDIGIRVYCRHDRDALAFMVTVPKDEGYSPRASQQRDGPQWLEDGIELFLQPQGGALRQFIVNTAGVVWDARDGKNAWDSDLQVTASSAPASWTLDLTLPLADLDVAADSDATVLDFNLVVRTQVGQQARTVTAVPTKPPTTTACCASERLVRLRWTGSAWNG